jgi:hypothetical protein
MRTGRSGKKLSYDRTSLLLAIVAGGGIGILALLLGLALGTPQPPPYLPDSEIKRAVIIDQLALTFPNQEFLIQAQEYLQAGGFQVDVFKGDQVTVEFYRTLPTKGYKLILLRSHATNLYMGMPGGPDAIFTSQPYQKNQYILEQVTDQIGSARVVYGDDPSRYFSIMANFVKHSMIGHFDKTLIILGGCQTLGTGDLAKAFLARGALSVIGWNEMVTLPHNDRALLKLLQNLILERQPIQLAIRNTMATLGSDPHYHSSLTFLP